nr:unnamed protein product [Callosobruchus analis]
MDRSSENNRANQKNKNNAEFWKVRGYPDRPKDWKGELKLLFIFCPFKFETFTYIG